MLSTIKKYYFSGIFCLLYALFAIQAIGLTLHLFSTLKERGGIEHTMLAILAAEWLALIAARYFSKKSAGLGKSFDNGYHGGGHYRR